MPTVSVLMPVYNCQRYVAEAVESILAQTFRDFEFLIIDDGSTDGSLKILQQYAARDSRIRLTTAPNRGIVEALNSQLERARGEFVARMDADDICEPTRFAKQVKYLQENGSCVALGCSVTVIAYDGTFVALDNKASVQQHDDILNRLLRGDGGVIRHPAAMLRTDKMRACGGYRHEYCYVEDIDLFLRMAEHGELHNLPEMLLSYRWHLTSTNTTRHALQNERRARCIKEACLRRGIEPPVDQVRPMESMLPSRFYRSIGWTALRQGQRRRALINSFRAWSCGPFSAETYKLMACIVRGR